MYRVKTLPQHGFRGPDGAPVANAQPAVGFFFLCCCWPFTLGFGSKVRGSGFRARLALIVGIEAFLDCPYHSCHCDYGVYPMLAGAFGFLKGAAATIWKSPAALVK